jgi:hypothetical protein
MNDPPVDLGWDARLRFKQCPQILPELRRNGEFGFSVRIIPIYVF